jgi:2-polyprenyl-3-methyl-5-hydroxy-6-metoxy-1,4-benzoquinol methylase
MHILQTALHDAYDGLAHFWTPAHANGIVLAMVNDSVGRNSATEGYGWTREVTGSTDYLTERVISILMRRKPSRVLDLGCGNASLTRQIHRAGFGVVGIDADAKGIEIARSACPDVTFLCRKLEDGPSPDLLGGFDAVVSTEVIEHLYRPEDLLTFAASVLRERGFLVLSTPYHGYLKNFAIALLDKWDLHHDPLWTGGHIKFWSRSSLSLLLRNFGFREVEFMGAGRLPYLWKSMVVVAERR